MLISFNVQNYRSFAKRQTISLAAGAGAKRKEQFSFPSENSLAPHLLRSVCLFGPNGAGKSTLVEAFRFFREFIVSSAKDSQEGEAIEVTPFMFDRQWREQPSEFEATFIYQDTLYQYGFAVDKNRVWGEWLFFRRNSSDTKTRTFFQREYDLKTGEYFWNINKKNVKGERELWRSSTRDNALFLSTAVQLKAAVFKDVFDWVQKNLRVIESPDRLSSSFTVHQFFKEGWEQKVLDFMRAVDIGITSMDISMDIDEEYFRLKDHFPGDALPEHVREKIRKEMRGKKGFKIRSFHQGTDGEPVPLDFAEESDGSRVVFSLAGPWLHVLENGYTLIIDELHNSLHPLALKFLVNLFHDPKLNTGNAQLIFTSHETSVMAKSFMHQDQVYFVEKDDMESSLLYPLSDYKVRDITAFQKAYLDGRYGAVPRLREFVDG